MAKLDAADWHWGSDDFPEDLPEEKGATHIGMFVAWAIQKGLWIANFTSATQLEKVRNRQLTGAELLLDVSDGTLLSEFLTSDGAAFAEAYYPKDYLSDYRRTLVGSLSSDYLVEDSWGNYDRIAAVIDQRWAATHP